LELSELLKQNFLRYYGKGEMPNQLHRYLSTNFKNLRNLPKEGESLRAKGKYRFGRCPTLTSQETWRSYASGCCLRNLRIIGLLARSV
jgi:hypothetical protein